MKIKKVLNSSVILVENSKNEEYILLSKGIGYGRKKGETVSPSSAHRIFIPLTNPDALQMIELFNSIPPIYLDITQEIVENAEKDLNTKLSKHIYLVLTDHIQFAVERIKKGLIVTNRAIWDIKNFYPKEFEIGLKAIKLVEDQLGIELPEEEAANFAFHIINSELGEEQQYDAMKSATFIRNISTIITYSANIDIDKDNLNYSRFVSHMQFLAERFFTDKMLNSSDDFMYQQIAKEYPTALEYSEKIRSYIIQKYDKALPNEEVAYLALHIGRLLNAQNTI